ncbi:MAG: phosphodiester glycosidase family protein [Deltaproteobacteria bacterium]|nr:phosphodiester glycosidase family protein [Deltaproteobacteria bacterium]
MKAFLIAIPSLAAAFLALGPSTALAQDSESGLQEDRQEDAWADLWSDPNPGVRYLRRTTRDPCTIHALVIDLRADGVDIVATPHGERWSSVRDWAEDREVVAAVNGGFWGAFARPGGLAVGEGSPWPEAEDDRDHGFFAVGDNGRAWISPPEHIVALEGEGAGESARESASDAVPEAGDHRVVASERVHDAVSGRPMLVRAGEVDTFGLDFFETSHRRHPRTAVGVSQDGWTVYLVVADGRREGSRGLDMYQLAEMLADLGAHDAINLDGGGSSTMFVEGLGGVINAPSGGRWEAVFGLGAGDEVARERVAADGVQEAYVRGVEREVLNHLGVVAPRLAAAPARSAAGFDGLPAIDRPRQAPPRAPLFRLGRARELIYPALWGVGLLVPVAFAFAVVRRRYCRRREVPG